MQVIRAVTTQKFGIPFSIGLAGFAWLTFTTVTGCWTADSTGPTSGSGCVTKSLMTSLINDKIWPLQYAPFTASWDSYDDKLAWLMSELYFRFVLFGIVIYGAWLALTFRTK